MSRTANMQGRHERYDVFGILSAQLHGFFFLSRTRFRSYLTHLFMCLCAYTEPFTVRFKRFINNLQLKDMKNRKYKRIVKMR